MSRADSDGPHPGFVQPASCCPGRGRRLLSHGEKIALLPSVMPGTLSRKFKEGGNQKFKTGSCAEQARAHTRTDAVSSAMERR